MPHPLASARSPEVVLLVCAREADRRLLRARLAAPTPGDGAQRPRRRVRAAVGLAGPSVRPGTLAAAAVDLAAPRGLEALKRLRRADPDLALLAFSSGAAGSDAHAAVAAGADFFHDSSEDGGEGLSRALSHAIDRRRLSRLIERGEAELQAARDRLKDLSGDLARALPGFRQPHSRDDVLPFREAARRYLLASARLFEGDVRGLARALGVSYFALRRLLARYDVPVPGRTRG